MCNPKVTPSERKIDMSNKINFTKSFINELKLPGAGKRLVYHDSKVTGLQLRVTSKGTKTFSLYRRIKNSSPVRVTIGQYPYISIEQARKIAATHNTSVERGEDPALSKREGKAELNFDQLFSEYIERYAKITKRTWQENINHYKRYLAKPLGKQKLSNIKRSTIASIHSEITKQGCPIGANRVLALVSSIYSWGISAGLCNDNPVKGIKRNREKSRSRFLQTDELARFFRAVAQESNQAIRDYVLISLLTGARQANVLSMRWEDINLKESEWTIERTKNNEPQIITLTPEATAILRARLPDLPEIFVFPGSGQKGHLVEPKKGWQRILARANIKDLRMHDLRRTLGSWQAKTGASLSIIGKSLNHKSVQSTAVYARLDLDPVRQSVEKATSAMFAAAGLAQDQPAEN